MKALILSHMYPRSHHPVGGIFVHEQVRELRRIGIDARVVSGEPFWVSSRRPWRIAWALIEYFRSRPTWQVYDGVPVLFFPYLVGGIVGWPIHGFTYAAGLRRVLDHVEEDFPYDLVHAHTSYLDGFAAQAAAARRSVPVIVTEHTGPFSTLAGNRLIRTIVRKVVLRAQRVLAVSEALRRDMAAALGIPLQRIEVLPNGYDESVFRPRPPVTDGAAGHDRSPIRALWVGHFVPVKRVDRLIEAFAGVAKHLPGLRLTLMGDGEGQSTALEEVRRRGLGDRVEIRPGGDRRAVAEAMNTHDFLIVASEVETFGVVVVEAFGCGIPVLSTRCGGPESLVTDAALGELVSNDLSGIEAGLTRMVERLGAFDRSTIVAHARGFTWSQVMMRLIDHYRQISPLSSPSSPTSLLLPDIGPAPEVPRHRAEPCRPRVLMITTDHLMIDRRILLEARSLIAAGYDVTLLAGFECARAERFDLDGIVIHRFSFDWTDPRVERWARRLRLRGLPGAWLRRLLSFAARRLTGFSAFEHFVLRSILAFDWDVLHCHDFPLLTVAVEAVRRRPRPLVYDAHELYHAQVQLPAEVQQRYCRLEARLIRRPDLVITVNPFIAEIMAKDYGIAAPQVILNATMPVPPGDRIDLRARIGIPASDSVVMYQGWLSENRGLELLVQMAALLPSGAHLVIAGYGAYENELRKLAAGSGERVHFLGEVANDELARLTPSADLGLIPYHGVDLNNFYCSPNKLFEYVAAGVPFVANDLPFLRSIVYEFGCGVLTDLKRPASAAAIIGGLLTDRRRLDELRRATLAAAERLNWSVEGRKLLALYADRVEPALVLHGTRPGDVMR